MAVANHLKAGPVWVREVAEAQVRGAGIDRFGGGGIDRMGV